jgi:UDP-3-O-[3-hydroxymyristoyl] glucosamine N-acyltransferase
MLPKAALVVSVKLRELSISELRVERDGDFLSIGRAFEKKPRKLVALVDESCLSSLSLDDEIASVITTADFADRVPRGTGLVISSDPQTTLYKIHNSLVQGGQFYKGPFKNEIDPRAGIHPTACIASESVRIGKGCVIGPNASILENSILESDVIVGAGSVIGGAAQLTYADGLRNVDVVSTGGVILHSNVGIHTNCCVNRAVLGGYTEIGEYTKTDNLVQIGENSKIGRRCIIPACASVGANVMVGDDVWIGPNSVISDNLSVGDKAFITIGSVVVEDVPPGQKVTGNFAIDHKKFIELMRRIR